MKLISILVPAVALAACGGATTLPHVHVTSTLQLEKNCQDMWPRQPLNMSPEDVYTCEAPTAILVMHVEVTCAGSTMKWSHDGWWFIDGQLEVPPAIYDSAAGRDRDALQGLKHRRKSNRHGRDRSTTVSRQPLKPVSNENPTRGDSRDGSRRTRQYS